MASLFSPNSIDFFATNSVVASPVTLIFPQFSYLFDVSEAGRSLTFSCLRTSLSEIDEEMKLINVENFSAKTSQLSDQP
jgi:hypothetical protein